MNEPTNQRVPVRSEPQRRSGKGGGDNQGSGTDVPPQRRDDSSDGRGSATPLPTLPPSPLEMMIATQSIARDDANGGSGDGGYVLAARRQR